MNINEICARYFEQHARNEKAMNDLKKMNKAAVDDLKEEIETGHRNAFAYALGDSPTKETAEMLKKEIERRMQEQ